MSRLQHLLGERKPLVMGILNVTPDSFSDGGRYLDVERAVSHALEMAEAGAHIIDIGGESTRPGAAGVTAAEETDRVIPVIEALRAVSDVPVSIDTSKPEVMTAAGLAGVDMINDVRALQLDGAPESAAATGLPVCLMHMKGEPGTMQDKPRYDDLVGEILIFFRERIACCEAAGVERQQLLIDIGFGFGKTPEHNLTLINRLEQFRVLGLPILVGLSRKSTIARIDQDRLSGSIAGALAALRHGADILRVHDVAQTVSAVKVWQSIEEERVVDRL